MILYHMTSTLELGSQLQPDYNRSADLSQPFVQALEQSVDCFYAMVLNGKYLRAVLRKTGFREWSNYAKWSVEGAFEYIRKTEFPQRCSRLNCCYYYSSLEYSKILYEYDWGEASPEEQAAIRLYEVEVEDEAPDRLDMRIFDEAYDAMEERQDVSFVLDCARRYFSGAQTAEPVWELLSDKPARAVRDQTGYIRPERAR